MSDLMSPAELLRRLRSLDRSSDFTVALFADEDSTFDFWLTFTGGVICRDFGPIVLPKSHDELAEWVRRRVGTAVFSLVPGVDADDPDLFVSEGSSLGAAFVQDGDDEYCAICGERLEDEP